MLVPSFTCRLSTVSRQSGAGAVKLSVSHDEPTEFKPYRRTKRSFVQQRYRSTGDRGVLTSQRVRYVYLRHCGAELFSSTAKYESTAPGLIGWPSFSDPATNDAVELRDDNSLGMHRTEVVCKNCGGHLGHVFAADDSPNGQHYCINSVCLDFKQQQQ